MLAGDACRQFFHRRRKLIGDTELFLDSTTGVLSDFSNNNIDVNYMTFMNEKPDSTIEHTPVSLKKLNATIVSEMDISHNKEMKNVYIQTELSTFPLNRYGYLMNRNCRTYYLHM